MIPFVFFSIVANVRLCRSRNRVRSSRWFALSVFFFTLNRAGRKPVEPVSFGSRLPVVLRLCGAFGTQCLPLLDPPEPTLERTRRGFAFGRQDQRATRDVCSIRAGVVQHVAAVYCGAAGQQRAGDRVLDHVHLTRVELQPMDVRVVVDTLVGKDVPLMAARGELHAAVLYGGFLQRDPDADRIVKVCAGPVCRVLVPRGRCSGPRWLEDGVVKTALHVIPKYLPGQYIRVYQQQRVVHFRRVARGIHDLGKHRFRALLICPAEIELVAFLAPGAFAEDTIVAFAQQCDVLGRGKRVDGQVALGFK